MSTLSVQETVPFIGQVFIRDSLYVDLVTGRQVSREEGETRLNHPGAELWLLQLMGFSEAQMVKSLPAMQMTQVLSLDEEDPLEEETVTHSNISWRMLWTEEPGWL